MKKTAVLLLAICLCFVALAGKIDKAFEALKVYNYFEAKTLFYKVQEKEPIAASFGLSVIYGRMDNPFHDFDSAYHYISQAELNYARIEPDEKEIKKLIELEADSMKIQAWKDRIDLNVYRIVVPLNNISALQQYIDLHFDSDWRPRAIFKRDSLAFDGAKRSNLSTDYKGFLASYPSSSFVTEAQNRLDERLFYETVERGSLKGYSAFLENYPKSPFRSQAEDSLYSMATRSQELKAYYDFIYRYPENRNVENSWRMLYTLYTSNGNPERIVEFRLDYPDYPYVDDLVLDFKLAATAFYPYKKNKRWGFVDEKGDLRIAAEYDFVAPYELGVALAVKNDQVGYINKGNQIMIPFEYEDGEDFKHGLAVVMKEDKLGMINKAKQVVLPFEYDEIGRLDEDLILVSKADRYGYVNHRGEFVIPLTYERAYDFQGSYALAQDSGRYGMINKQGGVHVPFLYSFIEPFNEYGLCRAKKDSLFGLLDQNGGMVLPFVYSHMGEAYDSLLLVAQNGKYGYAHVSGALKISMKYDFSIEAMVWGKFKNGYAQFKQKGKYGLINHRGDRVFPPVFESIASYNDSSLIAVKKRGKWGFSTQKLNLAIPYRYQAAETFEGEYALVKKEDAWYTIDSKGKEKAGPFLEMERISSDCLKVKGETGWGLIDPSGAVLVPLLYTQVESYAEDWLRFTRLEGTQYFQMSTRKLLIGDVNLY